VLLLLVLLGRPVRGWRVRAAGHEGNASQ
jgi:hypothetical protein